jgi:hypothetical protein
MAVIINEVEVIAPPPPREQAPQGNAQTIKPPGPTPHDIDRVTRKLDARRARLQAR